MAFDAFLKLDGIQGESTDAVHKGEIELLSFSWGESRPSRLTGGGGGGAGKTSFQDFHFTKLSDSTTPALFQAVAAGKAIGTGTLSIRKGGDQPTDAAGAPQDFLKLTLQNVLVSSYQLGGGLMDDGTYSAISTGDFDAPAEQFTLTFQKLALHFASPSTGIAADAAIDATSN